MLKLISEYTSEYPYRPLQCLNKFKDLPKYLHEMTLEEINNVTSSWSSRNRDTIRIYKTQILNYFEWLQSKGEKVDTSIVSKIQIPFIEKKFLIYSTADIKKYYDVLFDYLENEAKNDGKIFNKSTLFVCYASGILSFYGLTEQQIIDLELTDIQTNGIKGYDLPLTQDDINILMSYKNIEKLANGKLLCGTKYIRSAYIKSEIKPYYLSRPLWRINFDSEHIYLQELLSIKNLYLLGVYARCYEIEKNTNVQINKYSQTPQWFADLIGENSSKATSTNRNKLSIRKKEYLQYRDERDMFINNDTAHIKDTNNSNELKNNDNNILKEKVHSMETIKVSSENNDKPMNNLHNEDLLLSTLKNMMNKMSDMQNEIEELREIIAKQNT